MVGNDTALIMNADTCRILMDSRFIPELVPKVETDLNLGSLP